MRTRMRMIPRIRPNQTVGEIGGGGVSKISSCLARDFRHFLRCKMNLTDLQGSRQFPAAT